MLTIYSREGFRTLNFTLTPGALRFMPREKTSIKWIETGYNLFAHEGAAGIHIEKIGRMLGLNKSSFYHHFGTMEIFHEQLVLHHYNKIDLALKDAEGSQTLDPDYLNNAVKHKVAYMAQVQFTRHTGNPLFSKARVQVNQKIDQSVVLLLNKHLDVFNNDDITLLCLAIVRDAFYARVNFENFNYPFLHDLANEAKKIVSQIQQGKISLKKYDKQSFLDGNV